MAIVTVLGAHGSVVPLTYGSGENAVLAAQIAAAISAGVTGGTW